MTTKATTMNRPATEITWVEAKTAELLTAARRSAYFSDVILDAKHLQHTDGYAWDVALKISCDYWCN